MIDANEHKNLLAQIAQLEKDSVNYFDVEKEFFLIDSNNLSQVNPRLYGYSIQRSGIYEDDNLTPEAISSLDGRGCYVYVSVQDGKITIKQDLNGSWGIYLFRHGDYFALSNSFFRLLDHVKFRYPLTVNRDYCHQYLINDVCSHAYLETAVNEVQVVEKNAILQIDIVEKNIQIEYIDYKVHSVSPDSKEGIAILDNWFELWTSVLHGVVQNTKFVQADLSGGFDTRVSLMLLLNSGIDLGKVRINSSNDGLHTHVEDYEISTKIAEHYGFKLNQSLPPCQFLRYHIFDVWNIETYSKMTFHKLPNLNATSKNIDKLYSLDGSGGELIRGNWLRFDTWEKFTALRINKTKNYSQLLSNELAISMKNSLDSAFNAICNKYNIKDKNSGYIQQYLYQDLRARNHFGKGSLISYLKGNVHLQPVFDPGVQTLRFNTPECSDYQLLIALIFARYEPNLLTFPFQGKRFIAPETIELAKKINERFPLAKKNKNEVQGEIFHLQPRDLRAEKILSTGHSNPNLPKNLPEICLKSAFESSRTFGLFTAYFNEELYHYAANFYENHVFGRERPLYAILGITRVLEDVEISQHNRPLYQDLKHSLNQDFTNIHDDEVKIPSKFRNYLTARIDIKLMSTTGDFQIVSISDNKARITTPDWFQKNGIGYVIGSYSGNLEFVVKTTVDGQISLNLRGKHIRDPKDRSKRIPYWIDYTNLTVNGQNIFDTFTPAWHDEPYIYTIDAKADEEVKIQIEWLPHRNDT